MTKIEIKWVNDNETGWFSNRRDLAGWADETHRRRKLLGFTGSIVEKYNLIKEVLGKDIAGVITKILWNDTEMFCGLHYDSALEAENVWNRDAMFWDFHTRNKTKVIQGTNERMFQRKWVQCDRCGILYCVVTKLQSDSFRNNWMEVWEDKNCFGTPKKEEK